MNRFSFIEEEEINQKICDKTPRNTKNNTKWSTNLWNTWAEERNKQQKNPQFPCIPKAEDITKSLTEKQLVFFLKRFVLRMENLIHQKV